MKRTKDGGAILEPEGTELTKDEFERSRLIRDMIRAGVIGFTAAISLIFTLPVEFTIAIIFIMIKMEEKKLFKYCTVCGKKISWFRKLLMWHFDKDPTHLIPLSQFCGSKCANEGLIILLEEIKNGNPLRRLQEEQSNNSL